MRCLDDPSSARKAVLARFENAYEQANGIARLLMQEGRERDSKWMRCSHHGGTKKAASYREIRDCRGGQKEAEICLPTR